MEFTCQFCAKTILDALIIKSFETILITCKDCIKKLEVWEKINPKCHRCGKESDGRYQFQVNFLHFAFISIRLNCSEECYNLTKKEAKANEELKLKKRCSRCHEIKPTKNCGNCKMVAYCSQECQRADWPQHKERCKIYDKI